MAKFVKISLRPFTECCPLLTKCGQHEAKPARIARLLCCASNTLVVLQTRVA